MPVLAAGGIGDVDAARRALEAGADGLWLGSRFVASVEAAAHPDYKQRLVDAASRDTVLRRVFDIGWPDAPHRSSAIRPFARGKLGPAADRERVPAKARSWPAIGDGAPIVRYEDTPPTRGHDR